MSIPFLNQPPTPAFVACLFLLALVVGTVQLYRGRALAEEMQDFALAFRARRSKGTAPVTAVP